ncbi:MAG TPA: NnrS family protein, partial [Paracoccaceae bacterium]|nr:NnrS family protein [Paracoccaceae bacterium]
MMYTVFAYGFRIFFLSAAVYAAVLIPLWVGQLAFGLQVAGRDPMAWHAHELLFGVVAAAIAGFLLTAVPNWTARPRLHGWMLVLLWGLWMSARIGHLIVDPAASGMPSLALRLIDLAFLPGLALVIAAPIIESGNRRNFVMVVLLLGLFAANLLHGTPGAAEIATTTVLDLVTLMMTLIGGRITPMFTGNWLRRTGRGEPMPVQNRWLDRAATLALLGVLIAALFDRNGVCVALLALLAGVLHLARLAGWRGWRTTADPLVWVLHLGYLWIPVGLLLRGFGILGLGIPPAAWMHA